jgi:hypothetical protein
LPKFSYTTPSPETERNTPDFPKLDLSDSANVRCPLSKRVETVVEAEVRKPEVDSTRPEVIIQIPEFGGEADFRSDRKSKTFETQSKVESDV